MDSACEAAVKQWLAEITSPSPDPLRAAAAARAAAACLADAPFARDFARAWRSGAEDHISCEQCQMRLPDFIHTQLAGDGIDRDPANVSDADVSDANVSDAEVRDHLALCPHCALAYADVATWLAVSETDSVAVAASYPHFAVPSMPHADTMTTAPHWSADAVQRALAEGRQWIMDALGGVYVLLAPLGQGAQTAAWALKSGEADAAGAQLLAQQVLSGDELAGWEVEVTVFAAPPKEPTDAALCRVEVALLPLASPDRDLAGIAVTLGFADHVQTLHTNAGGVVEFTAVPRAMLDQAALHVELPR